MNWRQYVAIEFDRLDSDVNSTSLVKSGQVWCFAIHLQLDSSAKKEGSNGALICNMAKDPSTSLAASPPNACQPFRRDGHGRDRQEGLDQTCPDLARNITHHTPTRTPDPPQLRTSERLNIELNTTPISVPSCSCRLTATYVIRAVLIEQMSS